MRRMNFTLWNAKDAILTSTADRRARREWNYLKSRYDNIGSVKEHRNRTKDIFSRFSWSSWLHIVRGLARVYRAATRRSSVGKDEKLARRDYFSGRVYPVEFHGHPGRERWLHLESALARGSQPWRSELNSSSGLWTSFDSGIGFEQPFASYCFEEERESPARVSQSLSFMRENARANSPFKIFYFKRTFWKNFASSGASL